MSELRRITPSGVEIPDSDYKDIEKTVKKETLKTVFAVIGVTATVLFLKAWLEKPTPPETPTQTD